MLNIYIDYMFLSVQQKTILNAHEVVIHVHFLTKNLLFYLIDCIDLYCKNLVIYHNSLGFN